MFNSYKRFLMLAALSPLLLTGACANMYDGVPHGYYEASGHPLTPAEVADQDNNVAPRCQRYAKEINPSHLHAALASGWNYGITLGLAQAGGYKANAVTQGVAIASKSIVGVGINGAIVSGASGAVSGWMTVDSQVHGYRENCLAMHAGGVEAIPPSDARQIEKSGQPRTYGTRREGHASMLPPPSN